MKFNTQQRLFLILQFLTGGLAMLGFIPLSCSPFVDHGGLGFFILSIIMMMPLAAVIIFQKRLSGLGEGNFQAFATTNGTPDYFEYTNQSGIALFKDKRLLCLGDQSKHKVYSFDDVRKWRVAEETPGQVIGGGWQGVGANLGMAAQALEGTGLFVEVRDVNNPIWHVRIRDKGTRSKWFEILNQAMGE